MLFRKPTFVVLWFAQTFSNFGDAFFRLALPWLVIDMGGSANILGGVFLSTVLPGIIFSLIGGVVADTRNRKLILVIVSFLRAILMTSFFFFVFFNLIEFYHLYIFGILFGGIGAFANPAFDAILPSIVKKDEIQKANALFALGDDIAYTSGPLIAGLLIAWIGVSGISLVNALSFALLGISLSILKIVQSTTTQFTNPAFLKLALEGLGYLRRNVILQIFLAMFAFINLGGAIVAVSLPFYITEVLGLKSTSYGLFLTVMNIGIMISNLVLSKRKVKSIGKTMSISFIFMGLLGYVILGQSSYLLLSLFAAMIIEGSSAVSNILFPSWIQQSVSDEIRGRIFSLISIVSYSLIPLGYSLAGFMTEAIGIKHTLLSTGIIISLIGLLSLIYKPLRTLRV